MSNLVAGDTNSRWDVFLRDRQLGTTTRINLPAGGGRAGDHSYRPVISEDGSTVAFESDATNLLAAADTNASKAVFAVGIPGARSLSGPASAGG